MKGYLESCHKNHEKADDLPPRGLASYDYWEISRLFDISQSNARKLIENGELEGVKSGRWYRVFNGGLEIFFKKRISGVRREIRADDDKFYKLIYQGFIDPRIVERIADLKKYSLNPLIYFGRVASLDVSSGATDARYRLPLLETCSSLDKLIDELRGGKSRTARKVTQEEVEEINGRYRRTVKA